MPSTCAQPGIRLLRIKFQNFFDDLLAVGLGQAVIHGQADKALALGGGVDIRAVKAAELLARRGGVQRDIVEYRQNIVVFR